MDSTTPQGRLLRNIFASVAEYERELIRERVRVGQDSRVIAMLSALACPSRDK
jgi:DNA invertase Pin-like site-specific DNA recombinase